MNKKKDNQAVGLFLLIFVIIILLGVLNGWNDKINRIR